MEKLLEEPGSLAYMRRWGLSSGTTIGTYAVSVDSEGIGFSLR
jgi:hypothetical protein